MQTPAAPPEGLESLEARVARDPAQTAYPSRPWVWRRPTPSGEPVLGGASISGMKYSIPRLVVGVTGSIFREDADAYFKRLCEYEEAEFE